MPYEQTERDRTSYNDSIGDGQALMPKQASVPEMLPIRTKADQSDRREGTIDKIRIVSNEKDIKTMSLDLRSISVNQYTLHDQKGVNVLNETYFIID